MQKAEAQKSDVRNWSTVFFCTFLALAGPSTMDLFWDFGTQRFIRKTFFRKMEPLKSCPKKVMWEIGLLQCSFVPFWPWLNLQQWISSGILEHNPSSSWQKATYKKTVPAVTSSSPFFCANCMLYCCWEPCLLCSTMTHCLFYKNNTQTPWFWEQIVLTKFRVSGLSQITFALGVGRWSEKCVVYYIKSAN